MQRDIKPPLTLPGPRLQMYANGITANPKTAIMNHRTPVGRESIKILLH